MVKPGPGVLGRGQRGARHFRAASRAGRGLQGWGWRSGRRQHTLVAASGAPEEAPASRGSFPGPGPAAQEAPRPTHAPGAAGRRPTAAAPPRLHGNPEETNTAARQPRPQETGCALLRGAGGRAEPAVPARAGHPRAVSSPHTFPAGSGRPGGAPRGPHPPEGGNLPPRPGARRSPGGAPNWGSAARGGGARGRPRPAPERARPVPGPRGVRALGRLLRTPRPRRPPRAGGVPGPGGTLGNAGLLVGQRARRQVQLREPAAGSGAAGVQGAGGVGRLGPGVARPGGCGL